MEKIERRTRTLDLEQSDSVGYEIDDEFYFEDIFLLVEGMLYKLPRRNFVEDSQTFQDMFALPQSSQQPTEGSCKETPIILDGIHRSDFNQLLRVLFPRNYGIEERLTECEWASVLKLSSLWMFSRVRENAIQHLKSYHEKDPVHCLALSLQFDIKEWMVPSLTALAKRPQPISSADVQTLGLECALKVCQLREMAIDIVGSYGQIYNPGRNLLIEPKREALNYSSAIHAIFDIN
ncbi:unnamed protein product [Somion occarium]|uniref:BTB domain-containing protein n=1 Tax=Somion occarium TaxID=3059160 RepID=A0ABP1D813_9APHY